MDASAVHQQLLLELLQLQHPKEVVSLMRSLGPECGQHALLACMLHPAMQAHANSEYLRQLLKAVSSAVECNGQELIDGLAAVQTSLLLEPPHDGASWCHKTYCYGPASDVDFPQCVDASPQEDAGCITLRLSRNLFEGSTGCHEWEAGFFLAEFVLSHPFMFKGKRCVELGCGAGVVGMCLQRVGVRSVLLTDGDLQTLSNCRHNLALNGIPWDAASQVQVEELQWGENRGFDAEIMLGADLLYDPSTHKDLVVTLKATLAAAPAHPGTVARSAYLATTCRNEATLSAFLALLAPAQLEATALQPDGMSGEGKIRFRHHLALDPMRDSIILHHIYATQL